MAIAVLGLQSCDKKDKMMQAIESVQSQTASDLLSNAEELQKAEDALKNLPQFKGKELRVFQNVHFYGGEFPRIAIEILSPDNMKDVDHYEYSNGKWGEPQPVQISGEGDMMANTTSMNDIKFATVATVFKNWNEKAKTIEGADQKPLDHIYFTLDVSNQSKGWMTSSIEGAREEYRIGFNLDGSVKEFEKR